MKQRHCNDRGDIEPNRHIHVLFTAFKDSSEEVDAENYPDQGNHEVNRPLEFRVLLPHGYPEGQTDGGCDDDQLPTPEVNVAQNIREHSGFKQPLGRVVNPSENRVTRKSKNGRIRVQGP